MNDSEGPRRAVSCYGRNGVQPEYVLHGYGTLDMNLYRQAWLWHGREVQGRAGKGRMDWLAFKEIIPQIDRSRLASSAGCRCMYIYHVCTGVLNRSC